MKAREQAVFTTPGGRSATMWHRPDTNDWNTCRAAMTEDEYGLAGLRPEGVALDVGAHIGAVTVGLLLDHPGLRVVAVEPVPENAELVAMNARTNGVADRMVLVQAAAAARGISSARLRSEFRDPSGELNHHAWVGHTVEAYPRPKGAVSCREAEVSCVCLTTLLAEAGVAQLPLLKIDAEGAEWGFLTDPAVACVDLIVGEWHAVAARGSFREMGELLGTTHVVSCGGPPDGPGHFRAARKRAWQEEP